MLNLLKISQFAIVENLELEFSAGFTVITGETGAGKSILMDALGLCLGDRADGSVVRAGAERADVSALFIVGHLPDAVVDPRQAAARGAAMIVHDDGEILRQLGHVVAPPASVAAETGDQKEHGAAALHLVVKVGAVAQLEQGHSVSSAICYGRPRR